jgi:GMP reductase
MIIEENIKLDFKDVLIRPKRSTLSSRKDVELERTYKFKWSKDTWTGIPISAANMDGVGTFAMAKALQKHKLLTCTVKSYQLEDWINNRENIDNDYIAVSTGTSDNDFEKLKFVVTALPKLKFICIDVANGYSEHFGDYIEKVRKAFPNKTIIAGNVVTADMTQELILRGADIVKVGIGPGSVCTTRIQTGVGYPQLSAIIECADAAHGLNAHIIADGGCVCPGDVAKAFGAGADFVMLGGMFAGHDEGGGEKIVRYFNPNNEQFISGTDSAGIPRYEFSAFKSEFIEFYGMSSDTAMDKHHGGVASYRSSEGRTVQVPYKGPVEKTVLDILGGLRSSLTYVGAKTLKDFSKCVTFIKTHRQFNDVFVQK